MNTNSLILEPEHTPSNNKRMKIKDGRKCFCDTPCKYGNGRFITVPLKTLPELKTLGWWISRSMLNLFFLISRLNNACSPLVINLQIN